MNYRFVLATIASLTVNLFLLSVLASAPSRALTFDFLFTNDPGLGTVTGTVTGEVVGLVDNATSAATAVYIDSAPSELNLPGAPFNVLSPPDPYNYQVIQNTFTVSGAQITFASFYVEIFDRGPQLYALGLNLNADFPAYGSLLNYYHSINGVTIPNVSVFSPSVNFSSAVPELSTWTMMLLGFAGLGFAFRQSQRRMSFA
jgi:hypothetical protein